MSNRPFSRCDDRLTGLVCAAFFLMASILTPISASAQGSLRSPAKSYVYDGFTEPYLDIMVAAKEMGLLKQTHVKLGDFVTQGDLIATLDDEEQQSAVAIARLQAEMEGNLAAAEAEQSLAEQRAALLRDLSNKQFARPDELRRAEADVLIAGAKRLAAQEQQRLRLLELQRFQLQLSRRSVHAPESGVISQVFRQKGEYVSPTDPVIVRLLVIDRLIAVFNVPAEEISLIQVGDSARIYLRSTGVTLTAVVASIAPEIDGESGTVQVRVEIDNRDLHYRAGDRCTLSILKTQRPAAVSMLPRQGVSHSSEVMRP